MLATQAHRRRLSVLVRDGGLRLEVVEHWLRLLVLRSVYMTSSAGRSRMNQRFFQFLFSSPRFQRKPWQRSPAAVLSESEVETIPAGLMPMPMPSASDGTVPPEAIDFSSG